MSTPTKKPEMKLGRPKGRPKVAVTLSWTLELDAYLRSEAEKTGLCLGDLLEKKLLAK